VKEAAEKMKEAGARRALLLPVGGAFHSPLMAPAAAELRAAIESTNFQVAACPVYQNVTASPSTDPVQIQKLLIEQLTAPVRWTQSVQAMVADGASEFTELGPGAVLKGLVKKIAPEAQFGA
jgi:[acyl-carrier-protein] S-malonyltransferase